MGNATNPYEAGMRAAAENIPAEANPFAKGTEDYQQWRAGHDVVATAEEAGESEGG